jgi:hypothetical protein
VPVGDRIDPVGISRIKTAVSTNSLALRSFIFVLLSW